YATSCIDRPSPSDPSAWDRDAVRAAEEAPDFGASTVYGGLVCAFWKVAPVDREHAVRATGAPPILVVGTTDDPATPYKWAQSLASTLSSGVLLTYEGEGQTAYRAENTCIAK